MSVKLTDLITDAPAVLPLTGDELLEGSQDNGSGFESVGFTAQDVADVAITAIEEAATPAPLPTIRAAFAAAALTTGPTPYRIYVISTSIGGFGGIPLLPWVHQMGSLLAGEFNGARVYGQTSGQGLVGYTSNGSSTAEGTGLGMTSRRIPSGTAITVTFADPVDSVWVSYMKAPGLGTLRIRRDGVSAGSVATAGAASNANILNSDVGTLAAHTYTLNAEGGDVIVELNQGQALQRSGGVECVVVSCSGHSIQDVLNTPSKALTAIDGFAADLVIVDLGTLDDAVDIPARVAAMKVAVEARLKPGAKWMWAAPYKSDLVFDVDHAAVLSACAANDIYVIDHQEAAGNLTDNNLGQPVWWNGRSGDGVHPSGTLSSLMGINAYEKLTGKKAAGLLAQGIVPLAHLGQFVHQGFSLTQGSPGEIAFMGGLAAALPIAWMGIKDNLAADWGSIGFIGRLSAALYGVPSGGGAILGGTALGNSSALGFSIIAGRARWQQQALALSGTSDAAPSQALGAAEWAVTSHLVTPQSGTSVRSQGTGTAAAATGTVSHPAADANGVFMNIVNIAAAASLAEVRGGGSAWRRGAVGDLYGGFWSRSRVQFPDASYNNTGAGTGTRLLPLMLSASGAAASYAAAHGTGINCISWCREHINGGFTDANWQFIVNDGGATATVVDSGIPFVVTNVYTFTIFCNIGGTRMWGRVDDLTAGTSAEVSATTDLPAAATLLVMSSGLLVNETVTTRNIRVARLYTEAARG